MEQLKAARRVLDRLEQWAQENCMRFNRAKGQYQLGNERTERSPAEKDLDVVVDGSWT